MTPFEYFNNQDIVPKKQYDALHAFFYENKKADIVAKDFGYTLSAFYSLTKAFRKFLEEKSEEDFFFKMTKQGRKHKESSLGIDKLIIDLRKKNFAVEEILCILQSKGENLSYQYVYRLIKNEGFAKLHRRSKKEKEDIKPPKTEAPISRELSFENERFTSSSIGLICFLPYIRKYGIDKLIEASLYPETKQINRLSSILSFIALKISNIRRYSSDDLWAMDRGMGLFARLNVLPKNAWFSSYSDRITREMNLSFLRSLHETWEKNDLLSDTSNLDFTTIPYWGDGQHLENNWSGKRNKALSSILAVLAQDPESGIIDYGDTNVMHSNESAVVLEYLDFYKRTKHGTDNLRYLVFDSKFTNYENLGKLDCEDIKFITIRRRGKNIVEYLDEIPADKWKTTRVETSGLKKRTLKVYEENIYLRGYTDKKGEKKVIRQIAITGHGKLKPALIITNDFEIRKEEVIRKYSRRWLIEKSICEQIEFFHLNRVNSSMVIKVDFDFTMTILAHNIYRLLAMDLGRYAHFTDERIFEKFITNSGIINIDEDKITVELKKKRDLPMILDVLTNYVNFRYEFLASKNIIFIGASTS